MALAVIMRAGEDRNVARRIDADGGAFEQTAACAELTRAKDSREPVAILSGLERYVVPQDGPGAAALLRAAEEDLFR